MSATLQFRASAIAGCAVTLALCSLCTPTLAQTPAPTDNKPTVNKNVEITVGPPTKHQVQAAEDAYLAGARLLEHNDLAGAEIQFDKAVKLNPSNNDYAMAYTVTHQRHVSQ